MSEDLYAAAGVDTRGGDRAVELMKKSVKATHKAEVIEGVGGFAGLFDVSKIKHYRKPLLATSTDGVGTKIALAKAIDKHDTIGQDLVGMVVDDIVVVGAEPLFMTDYIACGKVVPERIAAIVAGIAQACSATGTALTGGETAEHPGLLADDEYDLAGAATGVVEADRVLGAQRVEDGDVVIALEASGLHSNGYSLVRKVIAEHKIDLLAQAQDFGATWGQALLEPTRLYTKPLLRLLQEPGLEHEIHALSHVTGGGIAANLARVLPAGSWVQVDRSTWSPLPIFRVLTEIAGWSLESVEGTWNLGIGMLAVVSPNAADTFIERAQAEGNRAWAVGRVTIGERDLDGFERGTKGVDGGAVELVGNYRS